jgi:hypothetical protein
MVVVDNARRLISKTIDVTVTSVLQTTAGKMIFGRHDERSHAVHDSKHQTQDGRHSERPAAPAPAAAKEAAAAAPGSAQPPQ